VISEERLIPEHIDPLAWILVVFGLLTKKERAMAGKPKCMSQIKQLLLMHHQGLGIKAIARALDMSKNTVKSYLGKLELIVSSASCPMDIEQLIKLDNPVLEAKFFAGNPAYKTDDERYRRIRDQLPYFVNELKRPGVTRYLLWQEYKQGDACGYGYSQFCFHFNQYLTASKPSMVMTHHPGEKLYIDFAGKKLSYIDRSSGEIIECQVFAACLPYSNYGFAIAVRSQTIPDFLYALEQCLIHLGGVPLAIVPDNLKSAVAQSSRYEPTLNQALQDFASHYGCSVVPARAAKPKDKSSVEGLVKLIYNRVFARLRNVRFFSLESLNEAITDKIREHNQTRMQQKPFCREELFVAEEKKHLRPLVIQRFEIKHYCRLTVGKNNHVYLSVDKHYYSVPYQYIGRRVQVIYTRSMVYIFSSGNQIAVHPRDYRPSKYTAERNHLCSQHQHYLDRSPQYYINRASKHSDILKKLIQGMFESDVYPEILYRSSEGLLHLAKNAEKQSFEKACIIAMNNGVSSRLYNFIKNCLENKTYDTPEAQPPQPLPPHNNIRGRQHYQQLELSFNHTKTNANEPSTNSNEPS